MMTPAPSPEPVRRAIDDGLVRPKRVGNSLVFTEADVEELSDALDDDTDESEEE